MNIQQLSVITKFFVLLTNMFQNLTQDQQWACFLLFLESAFLPNSFNEAYNGSFKVDWEKKISIGDLRDMATDCNVWTLIAYNLKSDSSQDLVWGASKKDDFTINLTDF